MKRLLLLAALCLPVACLGQGGARYDSHVMTSASNVPYGAQAPIYTIPFSTITVCGYPNNADPCTNTVPIFQDQPLTIPADNPITADKFGRYGFWATPGQYSVSIVTPGGSFVGTFVMTLAGGNSGGGVPGGTPTEVQSNSANTAFAGSGLFTNGAHTQLTTPAMFGTFGYNNPLSTSQLLGCNFSRSCQKTVNYFQDVPTSTPDHTNVFGFGDSTVSYENYQFSGKGMSNGSPAPFETAGWSTYHVNELNSLFLTPGISQVHYSNLYCYKVGDCMSWYGYQRNRGGDTGAADEAQVVATMHNFNNGSDIFATVLTGTPTTGSTQLSYSGFSGTAPNIGDTMYLIDKTKGATPSTPGNICAYDPIGHTLTTCSADLTQATAIGTTPNPITIVSSVDGTIASTTVNITGGSSTAGFANGLILFGCPNSFDFVPATVTTVSPGVQTITGNFLHGHPAGCTVWQGGTHGIGDLVADRIGADYKTSYYFGAATDATHIQEFNYFSGARNSIPPAYHNFGISLTSASLTRSANTTKLCNLGNQSSFFAGIPFTVSGASPSDFIGTFTASTLDHDLCVSYTNPGADGVATGATVSSGGAVGGSTGTGAYQIWNAAQLVQALPISAVTNGVTTQTCCQGMILRPNDVQWAAGDTVVAMQSMANKSSVFHADEIYDTNPLTLNPEVEISARGRGVTGNGYTFLHIANSQGSNQYINGGSNGQVPAPNGIFIDGAFGNSIGATQPYGLNPTVLHVVVNSKAANNRGFNKYTAIALDDQTGHTGSFWTYDPNALETIIGNNNSVFDGSQIILDFTKLTLNGGSAGSKQIAMLGTPAESTGTPSRSLVIDPASGNVYAGRYYQVATAAGCSMAAGTIGTICTASLTIPKPYAAAVTNYNVTGCTIRSPSGGPSVIGGVVNTSNTAFTVTQTAISLTSTGGGTISCQVSLP